MKLHLTCGLLARPTKLSKTADGLTVEAHSKHISPLLYKVATHMDTGVRKWVRVHSWRVACSEEIRELVVYPTFAVWLSYYLLRAPRFHYLTDVPWNLGSKSVHRRPGMGSREQHF